MSENGQFNKYNIQYDIDDNSHIIKNKFIVGLISENLAQYVNIPIFVTLIEEENFVKIWF